jgi:hypothetical protein
MGIKNRNAYIRNKIIESSKGINVDGDSRMAFASVLQTVEGYKYDAGGDDCHRFGSTFGCKEYCSVLEAGYCEFFSSVEDFLKDEQ